MAKRCPLLIQGHLSRFSRIMAAKNTKKFVFVTDSVVQTFLEVEVKQNTKTEFPAAENENRQLEDLPQADCGCAHEIFFFRFGKSQ